jgi:hypothetical protein
VLKIYTLFTLTLITLFAFSTKPIHKELLSANTYEINHFNITFAPDLSNRLNTKLYPRALSDVDILKTLTNNLYPTILRYRRSENQKDKLSVDFINKRLINEYNVNTEKLSVDFGKFKKQGDRIGYILGRNGVKENLKVDINNFITEFSKINNVAAVKNFGADIWTYLNEGVDNSKIALNAEAPINDNGVSYVNRYRNILVITTDGYIEAGIYGQGYDLSKNTIESFRNAFKKSGETDVRAFFNKNTKYRIKPTNNPYLKNVEILVLELYDRSKTQGGAATVQPTDMEIIKLFWSDWLTKSKVKCFELHPIMNTKNEAEKAVLNFMGINK